MGRSGTWKVVVSRPLAPQWVDLLFAYPYLPSLLALRLQCSYRLCVLNVNVVYSWPRYDLRDRNNCTQANTLIRNTKINTCVGDDTYLPTTDCSTLVYFKLCFTSLYYLSLAADVNITKEKIHLLCLIPTCIINPSWRWNYEPTY